MMKRSNKALSTCLAMLAFALLILVTGCGYFCRSPGDCGGAPCYSPDCPTPPIGICGDEPICCIELWDPVCGCDSVTHSNACLAGAAGVWVACEGECPCP